MFQEGTEREENKMPNPITVNIDDRIFRMKVTPSCAPKHADVAISELKFGRMYVPRYTGVFDVREFDTIELGAMCVLHTYLARDYEENEVAKKWQKFERKG
jgi:hypothetical protein